MYMLLDIQTQFKKLVLFTQVLDHFGFLVDHHYQLKVPLSYAQKLFELKALHDPVQLGWWSQILMILFGEVPLEKLEHQG